MPATNLTGQGTDLPVTMKALYVVSVFFFVLLKNDNVSDTCLSKRSYFKNEVLRRCFDQSKCQQLPN